MNQAILITYHDQDSLSEAKELCTAADYNVAHIIKQEFLKRAKFGITASKIDEIKELISTIKPDVIIFDEILKPSQNYNLASELKMEVLDRESLILEIFESRASSAESKLQVKLAQLRYEMSRAKEKVRLSKMGEQPGFMGIGQFEVDVYYNDIKHRMNTTKSKLKKAGKQRELHRKGRERIGFKTISLAGYTSAGKTTLFNSLTGEEKEKSPQLFTTLTTTTRRVEIEKEICLISDTVGFISKLPAYMIDAFKSTLEELLYTDIILVIIDIKDDFSQLEKKFQSCFSTLMELAVDKSKMIFVLNKAEEIDMDEIKEKAEYIELDDTKRWIAISAKTGKNLNELKKLIKSSMENTTITKSNGVKTI